MKVDVLLGLQWGDEGKGKIVDVLTPRYDIITRFQGGPNAGHTLEFNNIKHVLHNIPSGIFREDKLNIVANGVVLDPIVFRREIESLEAMDIDLTKNLWISRKAHLILPTHRIRDAASEAAGTMLPEVYWFESGKYDLIVTWQLKDGEADFQGKWSPYGEPWWNALVQLEGSEEAAVKLQADYNDLIASSVTSIARRAK